MATVTELARIANACYEQTGSPRRTSKGAVLWPTSSRWRRVGGPALSGSHPSFAAFTYLHASRRELAIAFRGTNDVLDVIQDDVQIALANALPLPYVSPLPFQTRHALNYARTVLRQMTSIHAESLNTIYLTGHSLGGALAILTALATGLPAVTFNAPGMHNSGLNSVLRQGRRGRGSSPPMLHIQIQGDLVSQSMKQFGPRSTVRTIYSPAVSRLNRRVEIESRRVLRKVTHQQPSPLAFPDPEVLGKSLKVAALRIEAALMAHSMDNLEEELLGRAEFWQELDWCSDMATVRGAVVAAPIRNKSRAQTPESFPTAEEFAKGHGYIKYGWH